nr:MAG TPA: hypothetical protein [Caudoviricetes sp.]
MMVAVSIWWTLPKLSSTRRTLQRSGIVILTMLLLVLFCIFLNFSS